MVVRSLQSQNPGLKPEQLAAAVDQFLPMMNAQARQEWQMLSMQLKHDMQQMQMGMRGEALDQRERLAADRERGMGARQDQRQEGADRRQGQRLDQQGEQFGRRQEGLDRRFDTREEGLDRRTGVREEGQDRRQGQRLDQQGEQFTERQNRQDTRQGQSIEARREIEGTRQEGADRRQRTGIENRPVSATEMRMNQSRREHQQVVDTLDDAIGDMRKAYGEGFSATGAVGKGLRMSEIVANITRVSDSTTANEFKQKIELLRTQLPKLLTGTSRTAKDERERINRIVPGLEIGSTQQITYADLRYLQNVLRKRMPEQAGGPRGGAEGAGAKALPDDIKSNVQKALGAGHTLEEINKRLKSQGYAPYSE